MRGTLARRILVASALLAVGSLVWGSLRPLAAQSGMVVVQGRVGGADGSVPRGAQVEARVRATGASRVAFPDTTGAYRILGLAPGVYDFTVRAIGWRRQRREAVRLVVGERAVLDFTLARGAMELEPTIVVATSPRFESQRPDISTAVLQEEIERLPLNTRNLLNLAAVAPGIRSFAPEGGRSVPAAGSLPSPRFINLYVDGVEWKGMYIGNLVGAPGLGSLIPQDAVREFRVYLNPYDAEYTRGASWVVSAVTHRGGNTLEGSAFTYLQNQAMNAKSAFQARKPDFYRRQAGLSLRGPLVRDRLFFALGYEGQHADNYVDLVPRGPPEAPARWDAYAGSFNAPLRLHNGLLRLTAPIGAHTVDAIWVTRHLVNDAAFGTRQGGTLLSRSAGDHVVSRINSIQLIDSWGSSSFVNELSLHFLNNESNEYPIGPGATRRYPGIQLGNSSFPLLITSRHFRVVDRTSWSFTGPGGRHLLKSGLEVNRARTITFHPSNRDGFFRYATDTSTQPASALVGMSIADPASTDGARVPNQGWVVGAYLQDQWQPVPRLTLTVGARYDAELNTLGQDFVAPWSADTVLRDAVGERYLNSGDRRNDLDNVAPRIAVAWDLFGTGRTFARGGFGVMYDRVPIFGAVDERIAAGWSTFEIQNPGTTDADALRTRIVAGEGSTKPDIVLLEDRLGTPASRQWSVGLGHELTEHLTVGADYLRQRVTHLYVTTNANWLNKATGRRAITERYGNVIVWDDFGDATFEALLVSATYDRAATRVSGAWTLGWSRSEFGAFTTGDYPDRASYSMQRSEGDERHRVVLSGYTSVPFAVDLSWLAIVASPRPFLVTAGRDVNQNNTPSDDWPGGIRTLRRHGWSNAYRTVDLRLARSLPMLRGRMTASVDVFNVFSWANHAEYQAKASQIDYGEPLADYARRQAQLGMRYLF